MVPIDAPGGFGVGHWAVDGGAGYTYFDPNRGTNFSSSWGHRKFRQSLYRLPEWHRLHLDWGASQFLSEQLHVGAVGYFYDQITRDSGAGDRVGGFEITCDWRRAADRLHIPDWPSFQAYLNLKGYKEVDATHRPSGRSCG